MGTTNTTATGIRRNSRPRRSNEHKVAIDMAVLMFRQPNAVVVSKRDPMPKGITDVIKASAGDDATLQRLALSKGVGVEEIRQAAQFYLRNLLTSAGDNPYRKLALDRGAGPDVIKVHKRWLLKWLHPDRNPSKWENTLFAVVNDAVLKLELEAAQEMPVSNSTQREQRVRNRHQRFHPVTPAKRTILKSLFRYLVVVLSFGLLIISAAASGVYQYVVDAFFVELF